MIALTDEDGNVLERYAYDPWGARRNPEKWEEKDQRTNHLIDRGYTGHEHIDAFAIINMNGRIYDPLTATFFSVDPYVQSPDEWLNYNRYAYCMFNPFLYVDPSGYTWFSKLGNWFRNNWESIVTTVVTVAVGVAVGAAVVASCGTAAPLLVAVCAGTAAGFAGGVTSGILSGQSLGGVMKSGLIGAGTGLVCGALGGVASTVAPAGALWGSLYGAGTGSVIGMVGSAMTGGDIKEGIIFGAAAGLVGGGFQGYCSAKSQGLNPWTGAKLPETTVNTPNVPFEAQTETVVAEKATTGVENLKSSTSISTTELIDEQIPRPKITGYEAKVFQKVDESHNFPFLLDQCIVNEGERSLTSYGNYWYIAKGTCRGGEGWYSIGVRPDGFVFHRCFTNYYPYAK